jgi:hypothetical protein
MRRTLFIMGLTCVVWGQVRIPGPGGLRAAAGGPISLVSSVCGPHAPANGAGGTSLAIDTTGANFLVQVQHTTDSGLWMSDTFSNNWHTQAGVLNNASNYYMSVYYVQNPTVGPNHTFTLTGGGSEWPTFCVYAFSGMATSSVFETGTLTGQKSASTVSSISVSTTPTFSGNNLVISGIAGSRAAETYTINSGFATPIGMVNVANTYNLDVSFLVQSGTATLSPVWSISPSATVSTGILAFKGAN